MRRATGEIRATGETRAAPGAETSEAPAARRLAIAIVAGVAGFALNGLALPAVEDVVFVFGGTLALVVAVAFGPWHGTLAAALAAARTAILWQHAYALPLFALEALAVGWLARRRWPVLLSVLAFWAAVGVPLAILLYVVRLDMPPATAWAIVLKAPLNGLVNALLAHLLLGLPALRRLLAMRAGAGRGRPLREHLFVGVTAVAVIPLLAVRAADGVLVARDQRALTAERLASHARDVAAASSLLVRLHQQALEMVAASVPVVDGRIDAAGADAALARAVRGYDGIVALYAADAHGRLVASGGDGTRPVGDIPADGPVARAARAALAGGRAAPTLAGGAAGTGGPVVLVAALVADPAAPAGARAGVVVGAVRAAQVSAAVRAGQAGVGVIVLDSAGGVVAGAAPHPRLLDADSVRSGARTFAYRAPDARLPRGREVLVARERTADGWEVLVEQPVHAALRERQRHGTLALAGALGTMVLAVLLAHAVAARVTRPLDEVVRALRRLSAGDGQGGGADVGAGAPAELRALARDFNEMAARLRASYGQLHDALCERESANARLGDVLAHLDGMVRERTADLQLAVSRAEEASAAKSRFLAHMSHELRTPLNSVIGFTNILRKNRHGTLRPDQTVYLERMVANAHHLLLVINDILDLSKIEAGKVELVVERVRVDELARETAAQFEAQVRDRGIRLDVVTPPVAVWAATDVARLRQVLYNLVGNAVKFTPHGAVTIVVTADLATGALAGVEVCDTGVGIPADRLASIFDAFEQVDSGAARHFEGTGLGLTISRALCRLLALDIEAHSVEGEGSVFMIRPTGAAAHARGDEPVAPHGVAA